MICCSVIASSRERAEKEMQDASSKSDIIEIRLDCIADLKLDDIGKIISKKRKPVIMTCRKKEEGGMFSGKEEERISILKRCIEAGADYVDVEMSSGNELISEMIQKKGKSRIIVSFHDMNRVPDNIADVYSEIKDTGCDIIKIVCMANSITDNLRMLDLVKKAKEEKSEIISFCMGEKGEISRLLCIAYGSFLTFGSIAEGKEAAAGQIRCDMLKNVYRADKLRMRGLKIYGLAGNPVSESKGILVHNAAFAIEKLNAVYLNFPVENLEEFMKGFRQILSGLAVTMPFKEGIMKYIDETDETAKKIGAVNTVVLRDGKLVGYNTDTDGAADAIEEKMKIEGKNIVMIGAGGAARAIGFGVVGRGGRLVVTNRTAEKGKKLAAELRCEFRKMKDVEWDDTDILINATSVGMSPKTDESPVSDDVLKDMVVFDAVYNPPMTKMLRMAEKNGCTVISGVRMFVNLSLKQLKLWTGKSLDKKEMEKIVMGSMGK